MINTWCKKSILKRQKTPKDQIKYLINSDILGFTEKILLRYGNMNPSHEGIVYWAGTKKGKSIHVCMAIAPYAESSPGMVKVTHLSNLRVVMILSENKLIHLGQVHSHPSNWVDHSFGDDQDASFKTEGLLSIVAPYYGRFGLQDLLNCGVHRFHRDNFIRLSNKYLKKHFQVIHSNSSILINQCHDYL